MMLELFRRAGIPFEVHNSHTTADAPQTVRHIRKVFKSLEEKELETQWETGEDVFRWWMNDDNLDGQMELSDFIEY